MENLSNLLSVVIVSYNSSSTVLETLESVLNQSYGAKNIELIVCDDCSSDNTCLLVEKWLTKNADNFYRTSLLISDVNQGISSNINRGWRAANADWVKAIAADDLLLPDCLTENFNYVSKNSDVKIVFSDLLLFSNSKILEGAEIKRHRSDFFLLGTAKQLESLSYENNLMAPSAFISRQLLTDLDYADERFAMLEDYPLWLKIAKSGVRFSYFPLVTVAYRVSESLSNNKLKIANVFYIESLYRFRKLCVWPLWRRADLLRIYDETFDFYESMLLIKLFQNKRTKVYVLVHYLFFIFRPYRLFKFIQRFFESRYDK